MTLKGVPLSNIKYKYKRESFGESQVMNDSPKLFLYSISSTSYLFYFFRILSSPSPA